jgi:hypothetical protein
MEKAFTEQVQEDVKLELAQVHACWRSRSKWI